MCNPYYDDESSWNPSTSKARTRVSHVVNTTSVDNLISQDISDKICWNIPASAPEGFSKENSRYVQ